MDNFEVFFQDLDSDICYRLRQVWYEKLRSTLGSRYRYVPVRVLTAYLFMFLPISCNLILVDGQLKIKLKKFSFQNCQHNGKNLQFTILLY